MSPSPAGRDDGGAGAVRLRPVTADALPEALGKALAGGPPVAPLPPDPHEREQALAALRPDEPVTEDGAAVVVLTSGSTGRPKGVVLSRAALRASTAATHERLGGPGDWLLALPTHHVAGLMVLVRARLAGTAVVEVGADLAGLPPSPEPGRRRYLSLVPTQLARALADPGTTAALAGLDAVLVGGAACPPALLDEARTRGVPMVTTYGMSETCGGCVYDGVPLAGVGVTLVGDEGPSTGSGSESGEHPGSVPGAHSGSEPSGRPSTGSGSESGGRPSTGSGNDSGRRSGNVGRRIELSGPVVFSGYRLRPDLTAQVHRPGVFRTADRGAWADGPDGVARLQVLGRVDDVVVTGGLNVDLAAVEREARGWPALAAGEVAVLGVPDPEWGTAVVAAVGGAGEPALADLRAYLRTRLPAYAAPRRLLALDALPRTSSGKIDRQRLQALLGRPDQPGAGEEPS